MGLATVAFHWSPETFWNATAHEFWAAYEVWREMNPPPKEDDGGVK